MSKQVQCKGSLRIPTTVTPSGVVLCPDCNDLYRGTMLGVVPIHYIEVEDDD